MVFNPILFNSQNILVMFNFTCDVFGNKLLSTVEHTCTDIANILILYPRNKIKATNLCSIRWMMRWFMELSHEEHVEIILWWFIFRLVGVWKVWGGGVVVQCFMKISSFLEKTFKVFTFFLVFLWNQNQI